MDVYIAAEALLFLKAQALASTKRRSSGILLGHIRGRRFFVETVYPCPETDYAAEAGFWSLQEMFSHRIIGFYSTRSDGRAASRLFRPFACGKLFLRVGILPRNRLSLQPLVIEFDDTFSLHPIPLSRPPRGSK
jgi:hypothetical protein